MILASVCADAQTAVWTAARRGLMGKDLNAVYFSDSKRGWIAGDGGFLSRTKDSGRTWSSQSVGTTDAINDVYFRDKEDGYLLAGNRIFGTTDGGETWRELREFRASEFGGAEAEFYSIRFSGKRRGWVVGSASRRDVIAESIIIHTNDGGLSWVRQLVPVREDLIHLDFTSDERGWVVGAGGTILFTRDGGQTWTKQSSGTTVTLFHVDFRNERVGWAVGERGTVLRTTDGGETWSTVPVPVSSTLLSVAFVDEDEGWIVGRGGVILRSNDGGRTWTRQESRTKENLYALFIDKKGGWAVGGNGMVLNYEK
ncbi:MAG TPA: YCF48-related protein [Pyrinomonadaceae bacterium]|nr:YCF48-related protein [Pyrinomonadaceae bacterium]